MMTLLSVGVTSWTPIDIAVGWLRTIETCNQSKATILFSSSEHVGRDGVQYPRIAEDSSEPH